MEEGDGTGAACVRSTDASERFDHDQLAGLPRDGRPQAESLRRGSGPGGTARSVSGQMPVKRVLRIRARQNGSTLGLRGKGGCGRGHSSAVAIWEGEEKMLKVRRIWPRVVYIQICKSALYSIRVNQECL